MKNSIEKFKTKELENKTAISGGRNWNAYWTYKHEGVCNFCGPDNGDK